MHDIGSGMSGWLEGGGRLASRGAGMTRSLMCMTRQKKRGKDREKEKGLLQVKGTEADHCAVHAFNVQESLAKRENIRDLQPYRSRHQCGSRNSVYTPNSEFGTTKLHG